MILLYESPFWLFAKQQKYTATTLRGLKNFKFFNKHYCTHKCKLTTK
jgi:hypothetical protein